ncbi:MAG: DUF4446 family protein [Patescibacteria group bacterium]
MNNFIAQNISLFFGIIAGIVVIAIFLLSICLIKISRVNKKSKVFFEGKNGKDLEELVVKNIANLKLLDNEIQEIYNISNKIHKLTLKSIHKFGIIRFNPFNDIGGDQSFSVAFLDGKNSGVVISSLHTKEGTRVYAKPVNKGEAVKYPLTEEEKKAINIALQNKLNKD